MKRKKHAEKTARWSVSVFLLAAGAACLLFPLFANALSEVRQGLRNTAYLEQDVLSDRSRAAEEKRAAEDYNRKIADEQKRMPFSYRGAWATDEVYESLLKGPGGQMAILTVPSAGIQMPVMHGTAEEILLAGAGHMYGTSLPVGGADTHCVLAGHSGLPAARLFTGLRDVRTGDAAFVTVLGEVHRYEVEEIRTVRPEEEAGWLQIETGADLLTLYTCTPAGINDHRLLVRCRRKLPDIKTASEGDDQAGAASVQSVRK